MKLKAIPFLLASTIFVTGCQQNTNNAATPNIQKEDAAIVVNGQYISKSALDTLTKEVSERVKGQNYPKDKLIDQLIKTELLVQEAQSKGLDQTPETVERLAMMRASVLSQLAVEDYIKSNPVTDADLKAAYDKQIADTAGGTEYKARHILVKDEPEAVAIIAKLDKGADFATLAKENSTGPSKTQGGDLGWFGPKQMVAPFSEAVAQLEKGKYTKTPVQTQVGWHIIILEDIRVQTPPPFEAVKAQLEPLVQREKLTNYLDSLLSSAQVEILVPLTEPAPVATVVETVTEEVTPTSDTVTETIEVIPAAE